MTPAARRMAAGKLSVALTELVEPHRPEGCSLEHYRSLVSLAASAWNLGTVPQAERGRMMSQALKGTSGAEAEALRGMVEEILRRREQLFGHEPRVVVDYEVTEDATGFHLLVASAAFEEA